MKTVCILQGRKISLLNIMELEHVDEIVIIGQDGLYLVNTILQMNDTVSNIKATDIQATGHVWCDRASVANHLVISRQSNESESELIQTCVGRVWTYFETDYRLPADRIIVDIPNLTLMLKNEVKNVA